MRNLGSVTTGGIFLFDSQALSSNLCVLWKAQVKRNFGCFSPVICKVERLIVKVFATTGPKELIRRDMALDLNEKLSSLLFKVRL